MSGGNLRTWVSDQLHEVAGISDMAIADFSVGLAQKSKSVAPKGQKIHDGASKW